MSTESRRDFIQQAGLAAGALLTANTLAAAPAAAAGLIPQVDTSSGVAGIQQLLQQKNPLIWVITGDSITHGAAHTRGSRSYPEHFAERVRWEMGRVRDVVINTGISGDRADGILADLDWRVLQFRPNVVSLMFGMNDCVGGKPNREIFRTKLTEVTRRVQEAGAIPVLNTPNTVVLANSAPRSDELEAYAQIVREIAAERQAILVDHYKHWGTAKPRQEDLVAWIEDKSIHPGVYGHREFAKLLFKELGIFDPKSETCNLPVP